MPPSSCLLSPILYPARPLSYPLPSISSSLLPSLPPHYPPSLSASLRSSIPNPYFSIHPLPPLTPPSLPLTLLLSSPLLLMRCTADSLTPGDLINHPQVRELLRSELRNVCTNFKSYERPLGWAAVLEPFSQVRTYILKCIQPYEHACTYDCNSNISAPISFEKHEKKFKLHQNNSNCINFST